MQNIFIRNYTDALLQGEAAIFAGAGLSCEAGFVNWKGLLRNIAKDIRLDIDRESDLISVAQYYLNEAGGNRYTINKEIIDQFFRKTNSTDTLKTITALPIDTYWTTNYDQLIENSLSNEYNKIVDVKIKQDQLATNLNNRDCVVYKFHGDISDANNAVLTKDDYEMFSVTHNLFITALKGDLVSKTFAFVGYGLNDPNFLQVLANIRVIMGRSAREHYCFVRRTNEDDYNCKEDYEYERIKQELYIKDIRRYGIKAVIVDEYSEIKSIFEKVHKRYLSNSIFVAGSCRNYGNWESTEAYKFMYNLGYKLIKTGNRISTGLIEGVGPQLVSGVLTAINEDKLNVEKHLAFKTLPLINGTATHIDSDAKKMFQENMISEAGIVLFLFGNQYYNGELKSSKGVMEDFYRAVEQNRYIIPIPTTGFASEDIFNEIVNHIDDYSYLTDFLNELETTRKPDDLVNLIIKIINVIKGLN